MRKKFYWLAAFMVALLNLYSCQQYISHSAHVLYRLPEWISAKAAIPNGLVTAQEFVFERQTLAGERLNLSEWNGYNEVLWNSGMPWNKLSFDADLSDNSYLWIFFSKGRGIRLSRNAKFKSGYFELNEDKEITKREEFEFSYNDKISLEIGSGLKLFSGTSLIFEKSGEFSKEQMLSFRSGLAKVSLDNIGIANAQEHKIETFSPRSEYVIAIALVAIINILFARTLPLQLLFLLLNLTFWQLDARIWSHLYYEPRNKIEMFRKTGFYYLYKIFGDEQSVLVLQKKNYMHRFFIPENVKSIFPGNGLEENSLRVRHKFISKNGDVNFLEDLSELKPGKSFKIGFFGSSQTFGGGAPTMQKSFPALTVAKLNQCSRRPITAYNFAEPGEDTSFMLAKYRQLLPHWRPNLLIVDMAHNDVDLERYRENLVSLLELNKKNRIATILILEPNSSESGNNSLFEKHKILKSLQPEALDLQQYLASPSVEDRGLLWWDIVHFDRAGHKAAAEWLTANLKRLKLVPCR